MWVIMSEERQSRLIRETKMEILIREAMIFRL